MKVLSIMQTLQKLSDSDKREFYLSISQLQHQLADVVQRFYHYFLQTEAGILFQFTEMETHIKMFQVTLAFLIAHIDNPILLNEHLKLVITKHKRYGVKEKHVPLFIDSFMSALKEFIDESNDHVLVIWNSVIYEIMSFFNEQLRLENVQRVPSMPTNIKKSLSGINH